MRLASALQTAYPWLTSLKTAQLEQIAQATGIQVSGPKSALIQRLQNELQQCALPPALRGKATEDEVRDARQQQQEEQPHGATVSKKKNARSRKKPGQIAQTSPMSILSIDMGIQNLAFAHLLVHPATRRDSSSSSSATLDYSQRKLIPTLNAWHRLAVSEFPTTTTAAAAAEEDSTIIENPSSALSSASMFSWPKAASSNAEKKNKTKTQADDRDADAIESKSTEKEKEKDLFSPAVYASHAYTLVAALLAAYRPTHILIERQRFRSGGGSSVQEWTLRVGVFEGMLYAVLHTLRQGGGKAALPLPYVVQAVEPRRVARYWDGFSGEEEDGVEDGKKRKTTKKRVTAREGKKAKIDLVGKWLLSSSWGAKMNGDTGALSTRLSIGDDPELGALVDAYLAKWQGRKKVEKKTTQQMLGSIGKLDDLADCLLQGVTWLDWHVMRDRISREGAGAVIDEMGKER